MKILSGERETAIVICDKDFIGGKYLDIKNLHLTIRTPSLVYKLML